MSDIEHATWTTHVRGETVEIPATIAGVRAVLPPEQRAEFDQEIEQTPAGQLAQVLAQWALPTEAWEDISADFDRLSAGDFSG